MAEQFSHFNEFNPQAAGEALGVEPLSRRDVAHGDGTELTVGETTLEVYQDAGVARVTTADARIELFRADSFAVNQESGRVVFEHGSETSRARLLLRPDGRVSFYPVLRATESPTTNETSSDARQDSPTSQTSSDGPTTPPPAKETEPQSVSLRGRLGRDPWFNYDNMDQPMSGFPLAVAGDRGDTVWHRVIVQGEHVEQVQAGFSTGSIKKGRPVEVTGQHVTRQEPTARGTRSVKEFHATSVTRQRPTSTRPPQQR